MARYRFEILGDGNEQVGVDYEDCADDLTALAIARAHSRNNAVRVWSGTREVAHLNCGDTDHSSDQSQSG